MEENKELNLFQCTLSNNAMKTFTSTRNATNLSVNLSYNFYNQQVYNVTIRKEEVMERAKIKL